MFCITLCGPRTNKFGDPCVRPKPLRVILPLVRKLVPGPPIVWVRIETCTACLHSNQNVDKTATMLRFSNIATSAAVEEIDHQF